MDSSARSCAFTQLPAAFLDFLERNGVDSESYRKQMQQAVPRYVRYLLWMLFLPLRFRVSKASESYEINMRFLLLG
jgi:hypothetical protein